MDCLNLKMKAFSNISAISAISSTAVTRADYGVKDSDCRVGPQWSTGLIILDPMTFIYHVSKSHRERPSSRLPQRGRPRV